MAGLAHLGIGLAAKRIAPNVNVGILILCAYLIDIIFGIFFFAGIERAPKPGLLGNIPWSHGLFMAVVWSVLTGLVAALISRNFRTSLILGLLVFSHWVVDFISHPMRAAFPSDNGLPIFFDPSLLVGLGVWSTKWGIYLGEFGTLLVGIGIYVLTLIELRKEKKV